jgi:fermentation-respiration switch protein FrsA (DUF1100 family)
MEYKESKIVKQELRLSDLWDKTFPKSDKVNHEKVTFVNRYGITLAADVYVPKNAKGKLAALAVCGPFGAVKEQAGGFYAQTMAERGFLTVCFDPSFYGESGGEPRYMTSPDISTEDFSAAVDFLSTNDLVDPERIGIIGICGWGGLALNAAAIDTRIKATAAITMYDMSRLNTYGYFDVDDDEARYQHRKKLSEQRTKDYRNGYYEYGTGLPDKAPEGAPQFLLDYLAYYKTPRGYHPRSLNANKGWNKIGQLSFVNFPLMTYIGEIRSAVLIVHGEKAHSLYFAKTAYSKLRGTNKDMIIVPGASHTDLYDQVDKIPFDKITSYFNTYLK